MKAMGDRWHRTPTPHRHLPQFHRSGRLCLSGALLSLGVLIQIPLVPAIASPTRPLNEAHESDGLQTTVLDEFGDSSRVLLAVIEPDQVAQATPANEPDDSEADRPETSEGSGQDERPEDEDLEADEEDPGLTREEFLRNPRSDRDLDPLLPRLAVERPLSPQEQRVLRAALDELRTLGEAQYQAGNLSEALEIWTREVRLRRVLGSQEEAAALGRVGEVAWRENQTTEVRLISERLDQIWASELQPSTDPIEPPQPLDFELLLTVGDAYRQIRSYDQAVTAYRQIAVEARRRNNFALQESALNTVAELHLGWFNYTEAASVYQEMVALAQNRNNPQGEITYLERLAQAYDRGRMPQQAVAVQEQIVEAYVRQNNYAPVPALKLAIAQNYESLRQLDRAAASYQEAFSVARSQQQFGYASDALKAMARLYEGLNRLDDALLVYRLLIDVEQQSYSAYGQMEAYDRMGQIYQQQGNTSQAIAAYRQGLAIAQQISYRQSYFESQIQALSQSSRP
jgi:tetratricopeptide (TPR) repeat protein